MKLFWRIYLCAPLHQILYALLQSKQYPTHLISDSLNFPTDLYVLDGLVKQLPKTTLSTITYSQEIETNLEKLKQLIKKKPGIICQVSLLTKVPIVILLRSSIVGLRNTIVLSSGI